MYLFLYLFREMPDFPGAIAAGWSITNFLKANNPTEESTENSGLLILQNSQNRMPRLSKTKSFPTNLFSRKITIFESLTLHN
jgi:hypothetical protein